MLKETKKCEHCGEVIDEGDAESFEVKGDWFCDSHCFRLNENFIECQDAADQRYLEETGDLDRMNEEY